MKRKILLLTFASLFLGAAAWLAGRYSFTGPRAVMPCGGAAAVVRTDVIPGRKPAPDFHNLSIPAAAFQDVESLEAWLTGSTEKLDLKADGLWMHTLAMRNIRVADQLARLDDESVHRLAEFLGRREVRERFEASQSVVDLIPRALTELARRDRAALTVWVLRVAVAGGGEWKWLLHNTAELTFRERLDLAEQLSKTCPGGQNPADPVEAALVCLRTGEIAEAARVVDALPEERRAGVLREFGRQAAFASGSLQRDWQGDFGPLLSRAFPEKEANDLPTRQTFYAMFTGWLGAEESGADCARWLEAQSLPPRLRAAATRELLSAWMRIDPSTAVTWRLEQAQDEDRPAVLEQIASAWVERSGQMRTPVASRTAEAAEWLQANAPGSEGDRARAVLAGSLPMLRDEGAGAAWIAAITGPAPGETERQSVSGPVKTSLAGESWQKIAARFIRAQE